VKINHSFRGPYFLCLQESTKTLVEFHQAIWCYTPEDKTLYSHHLENLKFNIELFYFYFYFYYFKNDHPREQEGVGE
jgi:hypothetical protein